MPTTTDTFFLLREGATQEEQWTWVELERQCRAGEIGAGSRVFLPDRNEWVPVEDTDLSPFLDSDAAPDDAAADEDREALEGEYRELADRLSPPPDTPDPYIEAASLAADLGDDDAARRHFQEALDRFPYNVRVAHEVRRRYPPAECRRFRRLERPRAAWEDIGEFFSFPLSRGPLYVAIPAAAAAGLLFVPALGPIVALAALLWCCRVATGVASGSAKVPEWRGLVADPVAKVAYPAVTLLAVLCEFGVVFYGLARGGMAIEGGEEGTMAFIAGSPVMVVAIALCALFYLPAVIARTEPDRGRVVELLNPVFVVRSILRMETEYVMTGLVLFALLGTLGLAGVTASRLPVLGEVAWGLAIAWGSVAAGFALGRLRARTRDAFR